MEEFHNGRRGKIFLYEKNGKFYARKQALHNFKKASINKEIQILKYLNSKSIDFVPQLVKNGDGYFDYKFINGKEFEKVFYYSSKKERKKLILVLLEKIYKLDKYGIIHGELNRPFKNIIVDNTNKIFILDFERGSFFDYFGKNMRSFSQRLKNEGYLNIKDLKHIGKFNRKKNIYNFIRSKIDRTYISAWIIFYSLILLFIDQLTKYLFYNKEIYEDILFITPILNDGIVFGIGQDNIFIYLFSVLALIFFVFLYKINFFSFFVFIFLFVGGVSNFIDRLVFGGVRDFIDPTFFAVFNFADVFITIGVILFIYEEFVKNKIR